MALVGYSLSKTLQQIGRLTPLYNATRGMGRRMECNPNPQPRCSPENIAKTPCAQSKKKGEKKDKKEEAKSMWDNPECCSDPCPDVLPRFDDLYYKPSDKVKRQFIQTWVECPEIQIRPKKLCCFENVKYPPMQKRVPPVKPQTACAQVDDSERQKCSRKQDYRCPKLTMRGCKGAREPPLCKPNRGPADCKKVCAPYPSFSECSRSPVKPLKPKECRCLDVVPMCEVWAEWRKQKTLAK